MPLDDAIEAAMQHCVKNGFLAEYLIKNGTEVKSMFFDELTLDEALQAADFERAEKEKERAEKEKERAEKEKEKERAEKLQAQLEKVQKELDALKKNT
jgi:predicted RNase H-like nuclease (RuvC/YqgF family)